MDRRHRVIPFVAAMLATVASVPALAQDAEVVTMPKEVVVAESVDSQDVLVGDYQQPEWTAHRRFPTTRVYVLPAGQFAFEQWWKGKYRRDGSSAHLFQSEIEFGLPNRFQIDLYENVEHESGGSTKHVGNQVEVRWAFADWGKIPLNPAVYAEWKFNHDAADAYELKLLLGEQLAPNWQWGLNAFFEQEVGGARATEMGLSQAFSYSPPGSAFSFGVEMNFEHVTEIGSRSDPEIEFLIGPSVQWRPNSKTYFDIVPLFGTTHDSPRIEIFIVFGLELGSKDTAIHAPASTRGR